MFTETWAPTEYTAPLSPQFPSAGPRLVELVQRHFRTDDGRLLVLDEWQQQLLEHLLERYPSDWPDPALAGQLRYRQAVISMGRQNGKSLLGAVLALWGLTQHRRGPSVVSIATSVQQANTVYSRVEYAVRHDQALAQLLRPTGTRGVRHRDGSGTYTVRPARAEGLQSVPISLGIADELHLMRPAMWDSIVQGQRAMADAMVVGITTAGDQDSELLRRLYDQGREAIADPSARFGFFLWQAPEGSSIDTPGALEAANPAIACGRVSLETAREDIRYQPLADQQRYGLNRWVANATSWLPEGAWERCQAQGLTDLGDGVTLGVERTEDWSLASVVAARRGPLGIETELVAAYTRPSYESLLEAVDSLATRHRVDGLVMRSATLGALGRELRDRGHQVRLASREDHAMACQGLYALLARGELQHAGDPIVTDQAATARRRSMLGTGWHLTAGGRPVDALTATALATFLAETSTRSRAPQIW